MYGTDRRGGVQPGDPSDCALFRLFPQVARAIQSVKCDDIRPYIDAIRQNVCSVCQDQEHDGTCETRRQVQCSLDAYLLLVVDAIEEATGKTFDKTSFQPLARSLARVRRFACEPNLEVNMNFDLRPFVALWGRRRGICAVHLAENRRRQGRRHPARQHGALTQQTALAQKLDVIDKWGKILTVVAVLLGLLVAAAYVYGQFVGRASMGV